MSQEDKELLLKNLCAGLPYGIVLNVPTIDGSENKKLVSIVNEDDGVPCAAVYSTEEKKSDGSLISYTKTIYAICDVLPYLRPMSSMTMEEQREYITVGRGMSPDNPSVLADWLNAHHFDYCDLIKKGLALKALEGMYAQT